MVERELLAGIKKQLLGGETVKAMAREIRRQARIPKLDRGAEIQEIDGQITRVVESLAAIGHSDTLIAKLRDLEDTRNTLSEAVTAGPEPLLVDAEARWCALVADLENLRDYAEPDEVEQARNLIQEIVGEVEVKEQPDGVFAYTRLNTVSGFKSGAQERT